MCIFCKIANHEIEPNIVYENENVMAFLDMNPINEGHTLIIPKRHYLDADEIPDELLHELMDVSKNLSRLSKKHTIQMAIPLCKMVASLMMLVIIIYIYFQDIKRMDLAGLNQEKNTT